MKLSSDILAFLVLQSVLAGFVWLSSQTLPLVVASHFSASGIANGFMPRTTYVMDFSPLLFGVPLLIAFPPGNLANRDNPHLNIRNRSYWLAPEHRDATLALIRNHFKWFSAAMSLLLDHVRWLVVQANELQPPVLSRTDILCGLGIFLLTVVIWLSGLYLRLK